MSLKSNSKAVARKQHYKVTVHTVEARRRREENMVQIRKSKREENLLKKRREGFAPARNSQHSLDEKLNSLQAFAFALGSDDIAAKEAAVFQIRKILSTDIIDVPIDAVIQSGVVPPLVDILMRSGDKPQLQFEAARALTNIASGTSEHTKFVIDCGALPIFLDLLKSENDNVREKAVCALGNIAGDSPGYRDLALGHGALDQVLSQFNETATISMIRNATWTISNLCRGKPRPEFDQVKYALPTLRCLINLQDDEVLEDACWTLSYLSDKNNFKVQAVIDAGFCPKLVELLSYPSPLVLIPVLRTLGNIVAGDHLQTQTVIDNQALPPIYRLITAEQRKTTIMTEICWLISNITGGTKEQIQAVINAEIFPPLLSLLANAEFDIKKEAAWAVSNATSGGSDEQIKYLAIQGCIPPLCHLLTCPDPTVITVCLDGLKKILRVGETEKNAGLADVNVYARVIMEAGGVDKIEELQIHENAEIYEKAVRILQNYLAEEDDDHMQTTTCDTSPRTAFAFSTEQRPEFPPGGFNFMCI